jgi:F420-dependent oxidoreductase-like protein
MHLDLNLGYFGTVVASQPELIGEIEAAGYRTVWLAEAYGSDVVSVAAWIGARSSDLHIGAGILQMAARTPAMTAMTAATLDDLTGGRFRLGLGVSGPQVVEGWHGVAFGRPLRKTRQYVAIVRAILARDEPVAFDGEDYQLPYRGEDATGLGKPLKLIGRAHPDIPIYLAAIGPNNVALAAEIADGWLPVLYSPERAPAEFSDSLRRGFAASERPDQAERFEIVPTVYAHMSDDIEEARSAVRPAIALYVGGMGAAGHNFYNDLCVRYGFEEAAASIQRLYLAGEKAAAIEAVPDELVDEICLVGPAAAVSERLEVWRGAGISALAVASMDPATIRILPQL